jgi:predicted HTH domain antitoxin
MWRGIGGVVGNGRKLGKRFLIHQPQSRTDIDSFARELPLLAAVKLYELGRLSSGRAAQLAGVARVEFLMLLERYKVFPLEADPDELATDTANA